MLCVEPAQRENMKVRVSLCACECESHNLRFFGFWILQILQILQICFHLFARAFEFLCAAACWASLILKAWSFLLCNLPIVQFIHPLI